jgi:hypothetical protein
LMVTDTLVLASVGLATLRRGALVSLPSSPLRGGRAMGGAGVADMWMSYQNSPSCRQGADAHNGTQVDS